MSNQLGRMYHAELAFEKALAHAKKNLPDAKTGEIYKFIPLILLDINKRRISGITVLTPKLDHDGQPFYDTKKKKTLYVFYQRPGQADFKEDEVGMHRYDMFDCEHNRAFLATHHFEDEATRYWKIDDNRIDREIVRLRKDILKESPLRGVDWRIFEWNKKLQVEEDPKKRKHLEGLIFERVGKIAEGKIEIDINKPKAEEPELTKAE